MGRRLSNNLREIYNSRYASLKERILFFLIFLFLFLFFCFLVGNNPRRALRCSIRQRIVDMNRIYGSLLSPVSFVRHGPNICRVNIWRHRTFIDRAKTVAKVRVADTNQASSFYTGTRRILGPKWIGVVEACLRTEHEDHVEDQTANLPWSVDAFLLVERSPCLRRGTSDIVAIRYHPEES